MLKDLTEIGSVFSREYSKTPKLIKVSEVRDAAHLYSLLLKLRERQTERERDLLTVFSYSFDIAWTHR